MKTLIVAFFSLFLVSISNAQTEKMEAVFIYQFMSKYVEWPAADKSGDFVVGVLGSSPIEAEFQTMAASKTVGSQKIVVKKFASAGEIGKCHVIYVPASKKGSLGDVKAKIGGNSTLVVSSCDGGAKAGAAINFVTVGGKLKFELNKANAKSQKLNVADALSQLAIIVN